MRHDDLSERPVEGCARDVAAAHRLGREPLAEDVAADLPQLSSTGLLDRSRDRVGGVVLGHQGERGQLADTVPSVSDSSGATDDHVLLDDLVGEASAVVRDGQHSSTGVDAVGAGLPDLDVNDGRHVAPTRSVESVDDQLDRSVALVRIELPGERSCRNLVVRDEANLSHGVLAS